MPSVQTVNAVTLRPATMADADRLLAWRNDPETRANSWNTHAVTKEAHEQWLRRAVETPGVHGKYVFIAEADGQPVGTGRLEWTPGVHGIEVSLMVAPEHRRRGYGTAILCALRTEVAQRGWARARLVAAIKPGNVASIGTFIKAGFTPQRLEMYG